MSDLTISALFTLNGVDGPGEPATGLTLGDIDLTLIAQDRDTLAETIIWNTVNPTAELSLVGRYIRKYTGADLDLYNYFAHAHYTGATVLDQDHISGSIGVGGIPIGTAKVWPYQVVEADDTLIEGVRVDIYRNATATGDPYWTGWTDAFGYAKDIYGNDPRLDPSPPDWYFFRKKGGVKFNDPDTETVV
jgi:hypothetical protein